MARCGTRLCNWLCSSLCYIVDDYDDDSYDDYHDNRVDVVEGVSLLSIVGALLTGRQSRTAFGETMTSTLMMLVRAC